MNKPNLTKNIHNSNAFPCKPNLTLCPKKYASIEHKLKLSLSPQKVCYNSQTFLICSSTSNKVIQMSFFNISLPPPSPSTIINALNKLDKCNLLRY